MTMRRWIAIAVGVLAAGGFAQASSRRHVVAPPTPTFSREVVRIFQTHCQVCHHPGGIGPFSLMDYETAKPMSLQIRVNVLMGVMPPWKPVAGCGSFAGENRLTASEISMIDAWGKAGSPEGNRADLPRRLEFPDQWELGTPDLTLTMPAPFSRQTTTDIYRMVPIGPVFDHDVYMSAMEIRPLARAHVHHILVHLDSSGEADRLDAADPDVGYEPTPLSIGFTPSGFLGTWISGQVPFVMPEGTAIRLPAGSRIVLEIHYHPQGGVVGPDVVAVGVHFKRDRVKQLLQYSSVDNQSFVIPANAPDYHITKSAELSEPIHLRSMGAHMHYLGQTFRVTVTLPDGSQQCLLNVVRWDPHWQGLYTYEPAVALPAHSRIDVECSYDNTSANVRNPFNPPQDVSYGGVADHEMCFAYFTFTADNDHSDIQP
jgi:hypothetical protein